MLKMQLYIAVVHYVIDLISLKYGPIARIV